MSGDEMMSSSKDRVSSKIDPSFKSKRYRDKLRTEIKALETLIPMDRSALHRKLDSQTIFRLVISYFRLKVLFKAIGLPSDNDQAQPNRSSDQEERYIAQKYFEGPNISQILDGFLLIASTDGTILFSTDNVLQYLGFNQVDLLHRCMYGVVHPDDHYDLKMVLEQEQEHGADNSHIPRQTSFICRMKCFNGTTAGYLKIHCVGKIDSFPALSSKSAGGFPQVIRLYCQPFMLTGNDVSDDVKQNVFWSKHDMDLKINELDKKAAAIIGYDADELNGRSVYNFVHPQDVAAFSSCHKSLVESTEVQTMYFRIITKNNDHVWLHSRGKVISKNSKKFSIVFTHFPVREEDSTFLQQESAIRQRFAINDLLQLIHLGYSSSHRPADGDRENASGYSKSSQICTPHMGFTEDVSLSFYSPLVNCPSTFHALSDRHSPVLPSTHVAHKITQREKQLQFQEFRRRQELEERMTVHNQAAVDFPPHHWPMTSPNIPPQQRAFTSLRHEFTKCQTKTIKIEPGVEADSQSCPYNPRVTIPETRTTQGSCRPFVPYDYQAFSFNPVSDNAMFHLPPSPPVSPRRVLPGGYAVYSSNQVPYCPIGSNVPHHNIIYSSAMDHNAYPLSAACHNGRMEVSQYTNPSYLKSSAPPQYSNCYSRNNSKPHANIRLSMHCDYSPANTHMFTNSQDAKFRPFLAQNNPPRFIPPIPQHNMSTVSGRMCGHTSQSSEGVVQYDIEASIHMKIVDNSVNKCCDKREVDLPSIGSFLDYLNEN